jgi:hypothetical protein
MPTDVVDVSLKSIESNVQFWPRRCGNSIFSYEGEGAGRADQVRYVELAPIEHLEDKKPPRGVVRLVGRSTMV